RSARRGGRRGLGALRAGGGRAGGTHTRLATFFERGAAAGLARVRPREGPLPAADVVALATCDGAAALGLGDEIGSLEAGKRADVIVVDVAQVHHAPFAAHGPDATLVHPGRASDRQLTTIDGRLLYSPGRHRRLDPERAVADAAAQANALLRRASR